MYGLYGRFPLSLPGSEPRGLARPQPRPRPRSPACLHEGIRTYASVSPPPGARALYVRREAGQKGRGGRDRESINRELSFPFFFSGKQKNTVHHDIYLRMVLKNEAMYARMYVFPYAACPPARLPTYPPTRATYAVERTRRCALDLPDRPRPPARPPLLTISYLCAYAPRHISVSRGA